MIREFQRDDINKVADIWLDTNIKAHNFIPAEYWKSNFKSVKEALLLAEVYVYEYDTEIQGFIGLNDEYVEGIFVSGEMQSQGIGKILLNYAKDKRNKLLLNAYQKNARAISFYKREGFERRSKMPYITIESGVLTDAQKEQLIKRLTEVSSEIMNVPQEFFATTIKELPDKNFGIGGKTIDKVKAEYMQTHK